jgi:hypothetical protein
MQQGRLRQARRGHLQQIEVVLLARFRTPELWVGKGQFAVSACSEGPMLAAMIVE